MNLKAYLTSIDMTIKDFSDMIGVSSKYISRIIHGQANPGKRLKREIEQLTGGQVNVAETLSSKKRVGL